MKRSDIKITILVTWILLNIFMLIIFISPFIFTDDQLLAISAKLQSPHEQKCILCGFTSGLVEFSQLDFRGANQSNKLVLPLAVLTIISNFCMLVIWLNKFARKLLINKYRGIKCTSSV